MRKLKAKALCLFLLLACFGVPLNAQRASLNLRNVTVKYAINALQKASGVTFVFYSSDIDMTRKVSVKGTNVPLEKLVDQVLSGQDVTCNVEGKKVIVSKKQSTRSQQPKRTPKQEVIKGRVLDENGEPIIGATIRQVDNKAYGTVTDVDGNFTLSVPENARLQVSYIGYATQVLTPSKNGTVKVSMKVENNTLNEVVVVGFGSQRKANLTEAVSTVDTKLLDSRPVSNLGQALQGTVPGLNLSVGGYGGQLGQTMSVNIRGTGTISTGSYASTLVLIDGIEGNMNNLNPDDIESISVLKDAASSSIYGSRAAFGVILITTKRGKAGKPNVSYSANARYGGPNKLPDPMNSWQFANFFNEGSVNDGGNPIFNDDTLDRIKKYMNGEISTTTIANSNGNWQFHEKANDNVNWYKTHYQWAWSQEHNVNISGGTDKSQYYASVNYFDQNGNLRYGDDRYKRFSANGKMNAKPYSWLDMEVNAKYVHFSLDNPLYTDIGGLLYHDITRMWPTMPFKDPNGYYMRNGKLNQLTNGSRSKTSNDNVYLQGQLVFHPMKNWNIYANFGVRLINSFRKQNLNKVYEHNVAGDPLLLAYGGSYASGQTGAMQYWTRANHFTSSVYSDYQFNVKEHAFKFMVGMNAEKYRFRDIDARRMDLITELVPELNAATGEDKIPGADAYNWATAGFFGRVNYDYGNRFFFTANLRYDGSSRFLKHDRWGTFGSFALGWNIASEKFFKVSDDIINQLKPRISWGTLGNQNTNRYYPMYSLQSVTMNGGMWLMDDSKPTTASVPGALSTSLTWETVQSTNIGFDLAMFRNRFTVNFDWYHRKTKNMVGPAAEIASVYGTSMAASNNTDMHTNGWELAIGWRDNVNDLHYGVSFNLSDARSYVDRYPNESKSLSTYYEGMELGQIWGYVTHGIAKSKEEMDSWISENNPTWGSGWSEGDIMYTDLNGDKVINTGANTLDDPGDRKIIGNSTPRYRFGLSLEADWKGFDFSMFWQGVLKRDLWLDGPMFWGLSGGEWQSTGLKEHLDYYRPAITESVFGPNVDAYYPKIHMNKAMNQQCQTKYLQSGAYARLKNIQIGYSLPKSIIGKWGMQRLRVYVSAENLLTISGLDSGFDPETAYSTYSGSNSGKTYPLQKTVAFGLNVTF